jgi:hypothetical protein
MEDIPTGVEVLAGMFFLHDRSIIILFDFGASHGFMSSAYAKKANLSLVAIEEPYVISTPRGRVDVDRIVQRVPLELVGRFFDIDHIILSGQGIDVILAMSWMMWHKAMLDIAAHMVHLNPPMCGKDTLHLPVISCIKVSLYHMVEKRL